MALFGNETLTKTPSVKFPEIGSSVEGEIVRISEPMQAKKYGTDEPDTWSTGKPKMQICVTLQTGEIHDDTEKYPDHNGEWGLWVTNDFSRPDKTFFEDSVLHAIQKAVVAAGAEDLEEGGKLYVEHYGVDPKSQNPRNPRKLYRARYQKPAAAGGAFTAKNAEPEEKPAVKSSGAELTAEQKERVKTMLDVGADPERIAKTMGVPVEAVKAVQDNPPF